MDHRVLYLDLYCYKVNHKVLYRDLHQGVPQDSIPRPSLLQGGSQGSIPRPSLLQGVPQGSIPRPSLLQGKPQGSIWGPPPRCTTEFYIWTPQFEHPLEKFLGTHSASLPLLKIPQSQSNIKGGKTS